MTTVPLADARADFSKIVTAAATTHERFDVTRNGLRAAVILGADDYDALLETLEILSDREAMADLREADAAVDRGETYPVTDLGRSDAVADRP